MVVGKIQPANDGPYIQPGMQHDGSTGLCKAVEPHDEETMITAMPLL